MKRNEAILVTGANGLAGSAVVEHLHDNGFTCVMGLTRADVDLRNHAAVAKMFKMIKPAHIFHAAATVYGLGGNLAFQSKSILDNTLINTAVIDAAHTCGSVKKITVMGTNAVYPWPPQLPYREETIFDGRPHEGEAAYGHAKRHMLAMLEAYQQSYGLEYTYLVSGNLYGPRDKFDPINGHVLPSLIRKFYDALVSGGPVVLWGDGMSTRDFLYSKDLARIVQMLMSEDIKPGAINIGSGNTISIGGVANILSTISGVPWERVRFDASKPNGRPDCYADLSRLGALGFTPNYGIHQGLQETWDWFERNRELTAA